MVEYRRMGRSLSTVLIVIGGLSSPQALADTNPPAQFAQQNQITDAQVRKQMIRASIAAYPGSCPCPYNRARNGSRCGKRSAWSRPGGYSPLCYPRDISDEMVRTYRARQNLN